MRFNCGPTWQEKYEARLKWHVWFAWHPIRMASHDCRWLEPVERAGTFNYDSQGGSWSYDYREIESNVS